MGGVTCRGSDRDVTQGVVCRDVLQDVMEEMVRTGAPGCEACRGTGSGCDVSLRKGWRVRCASGVVREVLSGGVAVL